MAYPRKYTDEERKERKKLAIKKYNDSPKHKACVERFKLSKPVITKEKVVKVIKSECNHGVAGFCKKCYYSNYRGKLRAERGILERKQPAPIKFEAIKKLVIDGISIRDALKVLKISSATLYRNLSEIEKVELKEIKILTTNRLKQI